VRNVTSSVVANRKLKGFFERFQKKYLKGNFSHLFSSSLGKKYLKNKLKSILANMDREALKKQIENMKYQATMERWPLSKSIQA
jgi:hypothetical protein